MMGVSLIVIGSGSIAADGDLRVNGNVGIGTAPSPYADVKLQIVGKTWLGNNVATGGSYSTSVGDSNTNYVPSGGNWNYTFLLNGLNTSSIGFHDAGHSVGSIRYTGSLFTIGGNDGWGNANVYFPGFVGIGTSTPGANFEVVGTGMNTLRIRGAIGSTSYWDMWHNWGGDDSFVWNRNGVYVAKLTPAGVWTASDVDLKENIQPIDNPLQKIRDIRGVSYFWKDPTRGEGLQIGVVAQEVEGVFPQAVNTESDGMKTINYSLFVPLLIEALKEQQKTIDALKLELSAIKR